MPQELAVLGVTAAVLGVLHTLLGPDHYLPFIAMARARGWSHSRALWITAVCGIGHVLGSVAIGVAGILLGWGLGSVERLEGVRGALGVWLLLGFGLAYTAWGVRHALRSRPHAHWHLHADGTAHDHRHRHRDGHLHVHEALARGGKRESLTPWVLFAIFVFGPCEPLIPVLMVPAALHSWWGVAAVSTIFAAATLAAMILAVSVGLMGVVRLNLGRLERYTHALAGLALVACGVMIRLGL